MTAPQYNTENQQQQDVGDNIQAYAGKNASPLLSVHISLKLHLFRFRNYRFIKSHFQS